MLESRSRRQGLLPLLQLILLTNLKTMPETIVFSVEMGAALGIAAFAIMLFVSELFSIDVSAILIMLLIGLVSQIPGIHPLVSPQQLFSGFSSNAVLSIVAIMIIGNGLDKTGLMAKIAIAILDSSQQTERRIVARLTLCIGLVSAFMQNVGATALFLPVVSRVANHAGIPLSRLLIPVGFCAILGGTLTMVGCSSLIILNDLIVSSKPALGSHSSDLHTFGLFDVSPIGFALLGCGVAFFTVFGKVILPDTSIHQNQPVYSTELLNETWGPGVGIYETRISSDSPIAGKTIRQIEDSDAAPQIISFRSGSQLQISPNRDDIIWAGSILLMTGLPEIINTFATTHQLEIIKVSADDMKLESHSSGLSEVVIPPGSHWIGHSVGEIRLRKHYSASLIGVYRGESTIREKLRGLTLQSGDTLLLYCRWTDLTSLAKNRDFVVASDYPKNIPRPEKLPLALGWFFTAMALVLFTDMILAFALLIGAVGMVISGVLSMDEAYLSVGWKTVFLLASLIPLGIDVNQSGGAAWLAQQILILCDGLPAWAVQSVLAVLATGLTLVISNVGATVMLVPVAMSIAVDIGANPSVFALTVALATSNSFLIPTHQVNALIMGPAGYRVSDFTRAGGIMTLLYLCILIPAINRVF